MVYIVDEGFMTAFQTGAITSAYWLAYAVTQIIGGVVSDKWHPEHLITVGILGSGIANLLVFFFYENYTATLIIWIFNAIVQFGVWPAAFKMISTMLVPEHRKRGLILVVLANPLGFMLCYVMVLFVSKWQYNFLISAIGLFIITTFWVITISSIKKNFIEENVEDEKLAAVSDSEIASYSKTNMFTLIISSGLIFSFIIAFIRNMIDQIKSFVPTMINASYDDLSPSFATVISLVVMFGSVCGPLLTHQLSKKMKNEYIAAGILIGATIPFAVITLFIGHINYWFVIMALAAIITLISSASVFITTLLPVRFNKWGKGATISGTINCFAALGNVAANFVIPLIADTWSWLTALKFSLASIILVVVFSAIASVIWKKFIKKNFN